MMRVNVIDTTLDIVIKGYNNVVRIETDPDDMTCNISYISNEFDHPIRHDRIKVGPKDTNRVVIY